MSERFKIACLQMNSGSDGEANLSTLQAMAREAAGQGAQFILTPEYCLLMDGSGRVMREGALAADGGAALADLQALAQELGVWLLVGSLTLRTGEDRIANRSFLISAAGEVAASYDKIHMFDVTLPDGKVISEGKRELKELGYLVEAGRSAAGPGATAVPVGEQSLVPHP